MSSKPKLIPGRYTKGLYVGEVRYLDPSTGRLYEFTEDTPHAIQPEAYGYLVCSPNGPSKVLHPTREGAEQEAVRLAKGNIAIEFTVVPVHLGAPVAKAYTPKPAPTLERF